MITAILKIWQPLEVRPICAALVLVATPWPTATHGRTIAGWELTYNDNGCEIYAEYDLKGGTDVSLNLNLDGTGTLLVGNKKWSITQGETVKLDFLVNGAAYQGTALGVSERFDQSKMFGAKLPPEFITDFAASPYLIVTKGATTVTRVSLSGSAEAIKAARRCVETVRAAAAAVEAKKRRESDIADDPFAQPASERGPASFAVPGGPKGNPGSWFTDSDYPADAKRAGAQGSVSLLLSVDTAGKVAGCRVTASSGNASLDNATCRLAERRGRFNVQKDAEGNALPYAYSLPGIHWSLKSQ